MTVKSVVTESDTVRIKSEWERFVGDPETYAKEHRLEWTPLSNRAEIAISISPTHRRKGYAKDLLTTTEPWARRDLKIDRLVALVLKGNFASMYLFESAGFRRSGEEVRMGKEHWVFTK